MDDGNLVKEVVALLGLLVAVGERHLKARRLQEQLRLTQIAEADAVSGVERDAIRILHLNVLLQMAARELGASSAVLILWEPTTEGGTITVIAEWPGVLSPSALKYQGEELGNDYVRDVISPLRRTQWVTLRVEELSPGSALQDLYAAMKVGTSVVHTVLEEDTGALLYTSIRFIEQPALSEPEMRDCIRSLASQICAEMEH